jgi:DNA-binding CsgD family transcriptional regulator
MPALFQLGELECWAGRLEEADRLDGMAAETQRRIPGRDTEIAMRLYPAALAAARRGDHTRATALAHEGLGFASSSGDGRNQMRLLGVLGHVALCAEDPAAADLLGQVDELQRDFGYTHPGLVRTTADYIESLIVGGNLVGARTRLAEFEGQARKANSRWAHATAQRCRGLLASADGDKASAVEVLTQAEVAATRQPDPLEHARTCLALGGAIRRTRQRLRSRELLRQAVTEFDAIGALTWRERARQELARSGDKPPQRTRARPANLLTPVQRDIAARVATGHSNKHIAGELFISPKTVEAHLSAIYRTLGVRSRTELAAQVLTQRHAPREFPDV